MIIIPAIDIINGNVVRLHQGDFKKETVYSDDPVETAKAWQKKGAAFLHIVDLDGAREGKLKNKEIISRIIKSVNVQCQVGGGLRCAEDIEYFLEQGARRAILGTKAFEDFEYLKKLIYKFGEKIVVSIDFAGNKVVKKGWQEKTIFTPVDMVRKMQDAGLKTIVVTDTTMDGTLVGPNIAMLKKILNCADISVIASGGVSCLEDIKKLKEIGNERLEGVIVGRALYDKKIKLEEAIQILC